ncbi:MAG TPA: right-handed parallel beta-helix repeat-containing protein, partial [Polyangiaceae bacterium]|nr:right-handed parallel beta-helix repeat-containing protein [Polyangiaceae bacterium]
VGMLLGGLLGSAACGSDSEGGGSGGNGAAGSGGGSGGGALDGATPGDAAQSDSSVVNPVPGSGECAWEPGARPTAALPPVHTKEYVIDLVQWKISNAGKDPVETRKGLNDAIKWAKDNGHDKIVIPPGTYLVGEPTNAAYAGGIDLQGDMTLELSKGTIIKMAPNDRWNYCVINVDGNSNITIRGGEVVGDRAQHDYGTPPTAHDEGHGICVWSGVDRVLIEDMELHELTGDGVLIVGVKAKDATPEKATTNVTIRNNHIHHNRRQGVSIVGGHNIVVENNHIHHIEGTSPEFGIDIEGAGRTDKDVLIYRNNFHHNAGGDFVTSSGRNVWVEENTMTQCMVNDQGQFDAALPCLLDKQVDGPIIIWKETDNVIINNKIRMAKPTVNGFWGILGYVSSKDKSATRTNKIGNYIAGNTFYDSGIHMAHNMRYFVSNNTVHNGLILGYNLACTRLEDNRINRTKSESYKLRDVAGVASGNILNKGEGALPADDVQIHFPMADDAPYRNSSPVFW